MTEHEIDQRQGAGSVIAKKAERVRYDEKPGRARKNKRNFRSTSVKMNGPLLVTFGVIGFVLSILVADLKLREFELSASSVSELTRIYEDYQRSPTNIILRIVSFGFMAMILLGSWRCVQLRRISWTAYFAVPAFIWLTIFTPLRVLLWADSLVNYSSIQADANTSFDDGLYFGILIANSVAACCYTLFVLLYSITNGSFGLKLLGISAVLLYWAPFVFSVIADSTQPSDHRYLDPFLASLIISTILFLCHGLVMNKNESFQAVSYRSHETIQHSLASVVGIDDPCKNAKPSSWAHRTIVPVAIE